MLFGFDFTHGWGELFDRGLEIVQTSGDHVSMVGNENIAGLAGQINSALDRYETEHNVGMVRSGDETDACRSAGQPGSRSRASADRTRGPFTLPSERNRLADRRRFPPSRLESGRPERKPRRRALELESLRGRIVAWRRVTNASSSPGQLASLIGSLAPARVATAELVGAAEADDLLPEEERALGKVSESRLRDFTRGRACAHRALAALGYQPLPILPGTNREPIWPSGVVGSITHCTDYCGSAVGRSTYFRSMGIDAERHEPLPEGVLDIVADREEREWIERHAGMDVCWDRVLFSAKESVYKAWHSVTGVWLDFHDAVVTMEPAVAAFRVRIRHPFGNAAALTTMEGRYLVTDRFIMTLIAISV